MLAGLILGGVSGLLLVKDPVTAKVSASKSSPSESQLLEQIQGLWQFPEHSVWIQVKSDGTMLQCRSNYGRFVALGKATMQAGGLITWDIPVWGKESISVSEGNLVFAGPKGAFIFARPTRQPDEVCRTRLGVD